MWQLRIGICKINRYASRESGDTAELVERPGGGLSVVLADAQGSGSNARLLGHLVTTRALALIKDGARDEAVHAAAHDHLYYYKGGRVSCTLTTLSADTSTQTYTVASNSDTPTYVAHAGSVAVLVPPSGALGVTAGCTPAMGLVPMSPETRVIACTDGVYSAGSRSNQRLVLDRLIADLLTRHEDPADLADAILAEAMACDSLRPVDDMTVAVLGLTTRTREDAPRRLVVELPLRDDMVFLEDRADMMHPSRTNDRSTV